MSGLSKSSGPGEKFKVFAIVLYLSGRLYECRIFIVTNLTFSVRTKIKTLLFPRNNLFNLDYLELVKNKVLYQGQLLMKFSAKKKFKTKADLF